MNEPKDPYMIRCLQLEAAVTELVRALEVIAAQSSGVPGSTAKADCMAAIASVALRNYIQQK